MNKMDPVGPRTQEAIERTINFTRHVVERSCSGEGLSPYHTLFDVLFSYTTYHSYLKMDSKVLVSMHKYLSNLVAHSPNMAIRSAASLELAALFAVAHERKLSFE